MVAFVLPASPNRTFELSEWPDGSFSLEPVAESVDPAQIAAARIRAVQALDAVSHVDLRDARTA